MQRGTIGADRPAFELIRAYPSSSDVVAAATNVQAKRLRSKLHAVSVCGMSLPLSYLGARESWEACELLAVDLLTVNEARCIVITRQVTAKQQRRRAGTR